MLLIILLLLWLLGSRLVTRWSTQKIKQVISYWRRRVWVGIRLSGLLSEVWNASKDVIQTICGWVVLGWRLLALWSSLISVLMLSGWEGTKRVLISRTLVSTLTAPARISRQVRKFVMCGRLLRLRITTTTNGSAKLIKAARVTCLVVRRCILPVGIHGV